MTVMEIFQAIGVIATGAAAVATAWIKVVVPTINFVKKIKKSFDVIEAMSEQFATNGGSSLRDAINRIEARQILQEQRHKLLSMDAPFAIFETSPSGDFVDVNRTFCRWVGRSTEELLTKGWLNTLSPAWRDTVFEEWQNSVSQQREFSMKFRLIDLENDTLPVFGTAFPLYDSKKNLVGWIGMIYKVDLPEEVPDSP